MQSTDLSVQVFAIYQLINKKNKKKKFILAFYLLYCHQQKESLEWQR